MIIILLCVLQCSVPQFACRYGFSKVMATAQLQSRVPGSLTKHQRLSVAAELSGSSLSQGDFDSIDLDLCPSLAGEQCQHNYRL